VVRWQRLEIWPRVAHFSPHQAAAAWGLTGGGTTQTRCPGEEEEGGVGEEAGGGAGGELRPAGRRAEQGRVGSVVWRRDCLGGGWLLPYILSECGGRVRVVPDGPADGLHGLADVSFLFFSSFLALYYWTIFLFLHIRKASPRLTLYRLKGKKGVRRLISLKIMLLTHETNCGIDLPIELSPFN
jgi:hypothetical protein